MRVKGGGDRLFTQFQSIAFHEVDVNLKTLHFFLLLIILSSKEREVTATGRMFVLLTCIFHHGFFAMYFGSIYGMELGDMD